jgi:hypothetical protein
VSGVQEIENAVRKRDRSALLPMRLDEADRFGTRHAVFGLNRMPGENDHW